MTIYEINTRISRYLENNIDPETGEILNLDDLAALELARDEKIENTALYYKNIVATIKAIKEEKQNLDRRLKTLERKAESLRGLIEWETNGEKFETARVAVSYRKSESLVVDDIKKIPYRFTSIKYEVVPDKTRIKQALKDGTEINGCHIETKMNMQVK